MWFRLAICRSNHITITINRRTQALSAIEGLASQAQEFARGDVLDIELELN
jgi:hypothetical protein